MSSTSLTMAGNRSAAYIWTPITSITGTGTHQRTWSTVLLRFLTHLFVPGVVQIWSGFLVSSKPGWSVIIRPPVNLVQSRSFLCFEGIVETDAFKPCPLFVNIKLTSTEHDIVLPKLKPLFQVQPVHQSCYAHATLSYIEQVGLKPMTDAANNGGMSAADWDGYRTTVRSVEPIRISNDDRVGGTYSAQARRRRRQEGT